MKLANFALRLTILLGLATVICTPELKNAQVNSVSESATVSLLTDFPILKTSLNTTQKSQNNQGKQPEVISMQTSSMSIFPIAGVIIIFFAFACIWRPTVIFGLVRIHEDEVGVVIKTLGRPIPIGQKIAINGEAGSQVNTLAPGWHWFYWSWMYNIRVEKFIHIAPNEIGLVEAQDGEILKPGQIFGQVVECNNFQDGKAFLENGGQRGKQRAILITGTYRINTDLFTVSKQELIRINAGEIGLIDAQDGEALKSGQIFGRVVDCNDFQNGQKFFENRGQRGKQIVTLGEGTYQINTELFKVRKGKLTHIKPGEIGLVEAKEGSPMPQGKSFGKVIDCDNFQDGAIFLDNGGQKGKQFDFLAAGTYQINTELFNIRTVPEISISPGEIGLIEAQEGAPLGERQSFVKVVDCNNFQDAQAFFKNGGQKGKQLAVLKTGNYQINTGLFRIDKVPAIGIGQNEIGLVEALSGASIPQGQTFGQVVDCDNFQDAQIFLKNGGQKGKQVAFLRTGIYYINTYIFKVKKVSCVTIYPNEIGLIEAQDGAPLEPGQSFGRVVDCNNFQDAQAFIDNGGQKGKQLAFLGTGNYQINTDFFNIRKIPVVEIPQEYIGLVEAQDGEFLPANRIFGQVVNCNKFQNAQTFLENGGQRGKQLAVLQPGIYQINTDLFQIEKVPVTKIAANEIGLVEAKDGEPLTPGKNFGQVVECNDFQNGQAFLENGGQTGKQLTILATGTYYINTDLFQIEKVSVTTIPSNEIGLVEAQEGANLSPGKTFAKIVDCNNFQNVEKFFNNGGQRGKQLAILQAGMYHIHTDLFKIKKVPVTTISSDEIGLVEAKDGTTLEQERMFGKLVDCNSFQDPQKFFDNGGQRGKQLAILQEGTYYINTEVFSIRKEKIVHIDPDEIGLVIANDGKPIERGQTLGKIINCNKFQDAEVFLENGGQQGKQLSFFTAGKYRINTDLFTVITPANAAKYGINPEDLQVTTIDDDKIGIVTTHCGKAREKGEIAGSVISGHENFRKAEKFIENGGQQGLQEEFLPSGRWILNPWFVTVKQVPLTVIPNGHVGVIKSNIGKNPEGEDKLVDRGYKGIWKTPLQTGTYQINTEVQDVVIIPINDLVLKWSKEKEEDRKKDSSKIHKNLPALKVHDKHGFTFEVEVTQIIRVRKEDAPEMLCNVASTVSSVDELIEEVLKPTVSNYFLNAAQQYEALDFQENRYELQAAAKQYIKEALKAYNVEAMDTLILEIYLPDELTQLPRETKLAEQEKEGFEIKAGVENQRQKFILEQQRAESAVEKGQEELKAEISAIQREEKRKEKEANLELQDKAHQAEIQRLAQQAEVKVQERKQMDEVIINSEEKRKNIDAKYRKDISQLNTEKMNEIEKLSPELYAEIKKLEVSQQVEVAKAVAMIQAAMVSQSLDKDKTIAIASAISNIKLPNNPQTVIGSDGVQAIGGMSNPLGFLMAQLSNVLGKSNSNLLNQLGLDQLGLNQPNQNPQLDNSEAPQLNANPSVNSSKPQNPMVPLPEPIPSTANPALLVNPSKLETPPTPVSTSVTNAFVEPSFPLLLLLDTSSQMSGECINKLNAGIANFKISIQQDINAAKRLDIAIVTFNSDVQVLQDFIEIRQFFPPQLTTSGQAIMGKGIELALDKLNSRRAIYENNRIPYQKPWILLIIGSKPTDSWQNVAQLARQAVETDQFNFFIVGVQGADMLTLREIAPPNFPPVMLEELKFEEMFDWLADSVKKVANSEVGSSVNLLPPTGWIKLN